MADGEPGGGADREGDAERAAALGAWVKEQWDKADRMLAKERRDYWLNLAFVEGEQWVYWHPGSRQVAEFPRDDNGSRLRLTSNRMQPNLVTLLAKLTKRELGFEVPATDADDAALGGARLGEHLLEAQRVDCQWEQARFDALHAAFLGGTSAISVEWDPNQGEELGFDPETNQPVNEGNIQLTAHAITEFTLEPGTRSWQQSRWWIGAKLMPVEQAKDHYDLDETPAADSSAGTGPLQRKLWEDRGFAVNVDLCAVYTFYQRPTKDKPKGRWAVVIGGKAIFDRPWPFRCKDLNIYPFRQLRLPKRWTGHTMLNDARPLQVAYNHGISMLSEHMKLAGNARLALPDTAGVEAEDLSDLPGEIITYDGMSSQPPRWLEPPNLPRWLQEHVSRLEQKLDDVMAVHDISRGVAPGDRNSGLALSVLAEKDETPMGLMAHDQSQGWAYIATLVLKAWEEKVVEYRETTAQSDHGIPMTRKWTGKMLHGQTRASVPLDNVLPHSRVALQAQLMQLATAFPQAMQSIAGNPSGLARALDLPGAGLFGDLVDADVSQAQRENMLMESGVIPSLDSRPFPMPFDNHATHIAEHNRFRKGKAYMYAPQRIRDIFDLHILAHQTLAQEEAVEQARMNATAPGAGALPQANEPPGSAVPADSAEQAGQQMTANAGTPAGPAALEGMSS